MFLEPGNRNQLDVARRENRLKKYRDMSLLPKGEFNNQVSGRYFFLSLFHIISLGQILKCKITGSESVSSFVASDLEPRSFQMVVAVYNGTGLNVNTIFVAYSAISVLLLLTW